MRGARIAVVVWVAWAGAARAQPSPSPSPEPSPAPIVEPWAQRSGVFPQALERFEFGDFEGVVALLRTLVESGARELPSKADRVEALRTYGIACTLTARRTAAEGAFILLLRAEPSTRLDPRLVRPEAVVFFDEVRARYQAELVAAYKKNRPRRYWILNLLPPAGQFQNRQRAKAYGLGAVELALLATNITTGVLLDNWQGSTHLFKGHEDAARALIPVNIVAFAGLLSVVLYGIVDGFVVGHRLDVEDRRAQDRLLSHLRIGADSLAVTF